MNVIDIILGGLIVFGLVRGFIKGFFAEIAALAALILGIYGAIHFSYIVGDYLAIRVDWNDRYIKLIAFIVTFIAIIVVVALLGKFLTKIADYAALGLLNRVLGAIFGALKMALILGIVLAFFDRTTNSFFFVAPESAEKSILYKPVKQLGLFVFSSVLRETEAENPYHIVKNTQKSLNCPSL